MGEPAELMPRTGERRSLRRRTPPSPLLAGALADLAAAATAAEVAAVAAEHAVELTGARAAAVGVIAPTRSELVLLGSAGYDCDAMAPGARLPLDAGLPITEAARTGAAVVRTTPDGGWVAVPLLADPVDGVGALLVSLTAASGNAPGTDVGLLAELAGHVRRALYRTPSSGGSALSAAGDDAVSPPAPAADAFPSARRGPTGLGPVPVAAATAAPEPAQVTLSRSAARRVALARQAAAVPTEHPAMAPALIGGLDIAVRIDPLLRPAAATAARVGGDLVEVVPDGHGGGWIVVADACGADAAASATAAMTGLLVRALGPHLDDPVELLEEIDALLASERAPRYVTALAMRVDADPDFGAVSVRLASAGHPLPLVALSSSPTRPAPNGTGPNSTDVDTALIDPCAVGLPLNLGLSDPLALRGVDVVLPAGASLFCFTDGLTDRRDRSVPLDIVEDVLVRSVSLFADATTALDTVFDVLAAGQGAPGDDAAAALLRVT